MTSFALALRGDVPRIESVGILTAANPDGQRLSAAENNRRFQDLRRDLVVYGMQQVRGRFGDLIHPLILANVTRATLTMLGVKYGQSHVIFGQREDQGKNLDMRFELLEPKAHKDAADARVVAVRKLYVPAHHGTSNGTDHPGSDDISFFIIPGFEPTGGAQNAEFRGARVFSYHREEIPNTPEAQAILTRLLARDRLLLETLSKVEQGESIDSHYVYTRRGDQNLRLVELHKLLGNWERFPMFAYEDTWSDAPSSTIA